MRGICINRSEDDIESQEQSLEDSDNDEDQNKYVASIFQYFL